MGNCPKCEKPIMSPTVTSAPIALPGGGTGYSALAMICPSCRTILSVQIDPLHIRSQIVQALGGSIDNITQ